MVFVTTTVCLNPLGSCIHHTPQNQVLLSRPARKMLYSLVVFCLFTHKILGRSPLIQQVPTLTAPSIYDVPDTTQDCKLEGKITVLFDASASIKMHGQDGNLKNYMQHLIDFLLDPQRKKTTSKLLVSVSHFGAPGQYETMLDFDENGAVTARELVSRIQSVKFSAGSCLSDALKKVEKGFARVSGKEKKETIIFVGDGMADCDRNQALETYNEQAIRDMQKLKNRGIRVIAFGFMKEQRRQITRLASSVDQAFFYHNMDGKNLKNALFTTLRKICTSDPRQVTVVRPTGGTQMVCVRQTFSEQAPAPINIKSCQNRMKSVVNWEMQFARIFESTIIITEKGSVMTVSGGKCMLNGQVFRDQSVCSKLFGDLSFLYKMVEHDKKCEAQLGTCQNFESVSQARAQGGATVFMEGARINLDLCSTGRLFKGWADSRAAICGAALASLGKISF